MFSFGHIHPTLLCQSIRTSWILKRQRYLHRFLFLNMVDNGVQFESCSKKKTPRKCTKRETTEVIEMLEAHPCLWNIFERCYNFREQCEKGFQYIQSALNINVGEIKAKITSLCAQLRRELAKTKMTKSTTTNPPGFFGKAFSF